MLTNDWHDLNIGIGNLNVTYIKSIIAISSLTYG